MAEEEKTVKRPFLLKNLPILSAKICFENMEISQLFDMSLLNTKMFEKIKEAAIPSVQHKVSFTRDNPSFSIIRFDGKKFEIALNQKLGRQMSAVKFAKIMEISYSYSYNPTCTSMVAFCDHRWVFSLLYHLYDHLAAMFPTKCLSELCVDVDTIKNFLLLLHIPEFRRCDSIQLKGNEMDVEDARFVLDSCQINQSFVLTAGLREPLNRPRIFSFPYLLIDRSSWVTRQSLCQMKCQHLCLKGSSLSDKEVNIMIRLWKQKKRFPNLKSFEVDFTGEPFPYKRELREKLRLSVEYLQFKKFDQLARLIRHHRVRMPSFPRWERRKNKLQRRQPNATPVERIEILLGIPYRKVRERHHALQFERGNQIFASVLNQPDPILMERGDYDIKREDNTWATLKISGNTLRMFIWPRTEPVPKNPPKEVDPDVDNDE